MAPHPAFLVENPKPAAGIQPVPRQDPTVIELIASRYIRSSDALRPWAEKAKKSVEYYEGKQWSDADLAARRAQRRPALTINKIRPLVNLVKGYFINSRTEIQYLPGNTGFALQEIADALTHVSRAVSEWSQLPHVDIDVALDGFLTGRGFYDGRLTYEDNVFGEFKWRASDPFAIYLDPDAEDYDLNTGNYLMESRWVAPEEIEFTYGKAVMSVCEPLLGQRSFSSVRANVYIDGEELTPWRKFGGEINGVYRNWGDFHDDWVDRARKTIRMVDKQWYVPVWQRYLIDLDTGDQREVPGHITPQQVSKIIEFAASRGEALEVTTKRTRRLRWTQMIGDIIVFDSWSPYRTFTKVPYFPYFRRGMTQGMVEHLMDAQDEVNKQRTNRLEIQSRSANGGWSYPKGMLDAQQKQNLEMQGATPGVHIEWNARVGGTTFNQGPQQIQPSQSPLAQKQLETDAEQDMNTISGINRDAMGQVDKVQSGAAIEAKQRAAIVGVEDFIANYHRSKELMGRKQLEVIQDHYKSERVIRVIGKGRNQIEMVINQHTAEGIINDVSLGKYGVLIDETTLSKQFLAAQFEELMKMKEIGMPVPDEFIIDASSVPRKEELRIALNQQRQIEQANAAAGLNPDGTPMQPAEPGAGGPPKPGKKPPGPAGPDGGNAPPQEAGRPKVIPFPQPA